MKIIIVEDQVIHKDLLELYVEELGHTVIATYDNGEDALQQINQHQPDVVLMDINLKGLKNGVDTAKGILEHMSIPVIFTTAQTNFRVLGSAAEVQPLDILIKPITPEQLSASLILAEIKRPKHQKENNSKYVVDKEHLIFKNGHMFEKQPLKNLLYVEGGGNYFTLIFKDSKATLKSTLSDLEEKLPKTDFCRINRSVIISKSALKSFNTRRVILHSGEEFNISKTNGDEVLARLLGA